MHYIPIYTYISPNTLYTTPGVYRITVIYSPLINGRATLYIVRYTYTYINTYILIPYIYYIYAYTPMAYYQWYRY